MKKVQSTCNFCAIDCNLDFYVEDGRIVKTVPTKGYPVNDGFSCIKGLSLSKQQTTVKPNALPKIRQADGSFKTVPWDEAFRHVADKLKELQAKYGRESVAGISTGQLTLEEFAIFGHVMRNFLQTNVDGNTRLCMASAAVAHKGTLGYDAPGYTLNDLELSDTLIFIGSNPIVAHPIIWQRVRNNKVPGHKIVVIDPRRSETARNADYHYPLRWRSDLTLMYTLANLIIEKDYVDHEFVDAHTQGGSFEGLYYNRGVCGLLNGICADNRIRGLFQMNGGRAGRYSGTFVQLDNLPNCRLMELDRMREAVLHGDRVYMETCHETIPELLGELLPTVFVPTPGSSMALVELTGIEDKVIDWLIHSEYQAIDKEEFHGLHDVNDPRFCALCADVDAAVHLCLGNKRYITEYGLAFEYSDWLDQLLITLPSGRQLHYTQPRLKKVCDNHVEVITFTEYDRDGLARIREMDGDGFVRDVIRGIVRDLLFAGLSKLESAGIQVVMHFHNSVLIDSTSEMQLFKACELMSSVPAWAKGMRPSFHAYYCHDYYEKTTQVIR